MARLVVKSGVARGKEFTLADDQTIGRLAKNGIPIEDSRMSRENTRIYRVGRRWMVEDLSSKNGTFLNGAKVEKAVLTADDEVRVGETHFSFCLDEAELAEIATPTSSDDIESREMGVSKRALSYSKYASDEATQTSLLWVRQDLGQRDGFFKVLIFLGIGLFAVGLFFLVQMLIGG